MNRVFLCFQHLASKICQEMTTGHVNPGYENLVSGMKAAIGNPSGAPTKAQLNAAELAEIRARSRSVWSGKDNSETTYGYFYTDPKKISQVRTRPTSPTRLNNPHPKNVFMVSRMKHIPGYFDASQAYEKSNTPVHYQYMDTVEDRLDALRPKSYKSRPQSSLAFTNANEYLNYLTPEEAQKTKVHFQNAGIDLTKVRKSSGNMPINPAQLDQVIFKNYENGNLVTSTETVLTDRSKNELQSNSTNPYLYDDYRIYKEKYASGNHGMPNPNAKKPARGDFLIHYDWGPHLKHHKLPCDC